MNRERDRTEFAGLLQNQPPGTACTSDLDSLSAAGGSFQQVLVAARR